MVISLYPGANRDDVLRTLRELQSALTNAGNTMGAYPRLLAYLEWATNSVRMLEHRIAPREISRLVLTAGYERLLSAGTGLTGTDVGTSRVLNGLLDLEIRQRDEAFGAAIADLDRQIQKWTGHIAFTLPDTSFYIQHEKLLRDIDFAEILGAWQEMRVRILVPMLILDELDALKRKGDQHTKWRASYTLSVFEDLFQPGSHGLLHKADPASMRGTVAMEILYDPSGHERLPINDDEIIDRAVAAQSLAGSPFTFLTFDTSQTLRARHRGLFAKNLSKPAGEPPAAPKSKRTDTTSHQKNAAGA